ncbi:YtpI family protein [Paenibacillus aurantius]|uniref:YtpI family protein n=1 Tax=Paenibacillus aurantius TaxID=2918900 RepID=A0AA96LB97_9BACL|nr:YtpI family protein [Paenibacillus aurantius]WNQ09949.1 YtpI family protein [Paenibacillus aurantius]
MIAWYHYLFFALILLALLGTVVYSYRYRVQKDPVRRGLLAARMNLCMGAMLILFALVQFLLFEVSKVRVVLGVLFLLLGFFNLFAGLRNHSFYSSRKA